jgi:hypothetical protein
MGHHAQYRKRGGHGPGNPLMTTPVPPTLADYGDTIQINPAGGNDTGGNFKTYRSTTGGPPWVEAVAVAWNRPGLVGRDNFSPPCYIYATEVGNGQNYLGQSTASNILHLT